MAFGPCVTYLRDLVCVAAASLIAEIDAVAQLLHPVACHTFYQNDLFVMVDITIRHLVR
jgi:hypothetical protein